MIDKIKSILKIILLNTLPRLYKRLFYADISKLNTEGIKSMKRGEPEMLILDQIVPNNRPAFDIGANYGDYTFLLEKLIPPNLIYAFEPIPELSKRLSKVFPQVNILEFAVSNDDASAIFKIPKVKYKVLYSRGTLQTHLTEENETGQYTIRVDTLTLDSFSQQYNISDLGFIKIDVEGNELNVIKGGLNTIKKYKPVILVEIEQRHHSVNINEIIEFIKNLMYSCYYLNEKLELTELMENAVNLQTSKKVYINNFIFLPEK